MTHDAQRKLVALVLLTSVATLLIASALPQLKLEAGIPLPGPDDNPGGSTADGSPTFSISVATYVKAVLLVIGVLVVTYTAYKAIRGVPWREILGPTLLIAVAVLLVLSALLALQGGRIATDPLAPDVLPPEIQIAGPPLAPLPPAVMWLVAIILAAAILILGTYFARLWSMQSRAGDPLASAAEQAIQALKAGQDLPGVIVRCYREMSLTLQAEQGIKRHETMTAREFERLLQARGVPYAPVHRLTGLFESVRYGLRPPGPEDEHAALESLGAIVAYSHETNGGPV